MRIVLAVLFFLALLAVGIYVDVVWLLVGGIEEIVRGAQSVPVSVRDIAWGAVRVLCCGVGAGIGVIIGVVGGGAIMATGD